MIRDWRSCVTTPQQNISLSLEQVSENFSWILIAIYTYRRQARGDRARTDTLAIECDRDVICTPCVMGVSRLNRTAGAIPGSRSKKSFFFPADARISAIFL